MAYKVTTEGMDQLTNKLRALGDAAGKVAAEGLYEGAGVMADAVSRAVQGIATKTFHYAIGWQRYPSPEEKELLLKAAHGIAKFRKGGADISTSVGFSKAGYGELNGKTVPIPKIANAINSGTSFRKKQPFFRKAVSQSRSMTLAAIENSIEKRFEEITKD